MNNQQTKLKLRVVTDPKPRRHPKWKSDAELQRLPLVNVHDSGRPPLPQRGHEELELLIGKRVNDK